MNFVQLFLFGVYFLSVFLCGISIYQFLNRDNAFKLNRTILFGEVLLIGSIFVIGQLLLLSLLHLYKAPYLWGCILLNCSIIFLRKVRQGLKSFVVPGIKLDLPLCILVLLLSIWIFRNYLPLIETDSVTAYLFIQKLWLSKGTSLCGGPFNDVRIFLPHLNAVPYSLGISVFPKETLFPQFINIFWRFIVLVLVFGYTSYRFNRWYGLAATMFVLFNDYFFYSGTCFCFIVNGAVTALFFAMIYNFWEARKQNSSFRFLLALIFASQIMANKYQMFYAFLLTLLLCLYIQQGVLVKIKELINNKRWLVIFLASCIILGFWYLKNLIVTGDPVFPLFAGKLGIFNWTPEKEMVLRKWHGLHLNPFLFFKYIGFLFVWPGISALKYVIVTIICVPFIVGFLLLKSRLEEAISLELFFWLAISIVTVFGIFFAEWIDAKFYRYPIGVFSFTAVFSLRYILKQVFKIKKEFILCGCILFLAIKQGRNEGLRVIWRQGEGFSIPTFKQNFDTLRNKIHTDYALQTWFGHIFSITRIQELLVNNKDKLDKMAWDYDSFGLALPVFFFPEIPMVSMWCNAVVKWDSYTNPELIVKDLKKTPIEWIIRSGPVLESIEEYAKRVSTYERYPKKVYFDFDFFPKELSDIKY